MFGPVALHLLANLGAAALAVFLWVLLRPRRSEVPFDVNPVLFGSLMACGSLASMMAPMTYQPGVIFDFRAVWVTLAGFLGGPLAAVVATVPGLAYRAWVGGAGVYAGLANLFVSAAFGVIAWRWRKRSQRDDGDTAKTQPMSEMPLLIGLAIAAASAGVATLVLLPLDLASRLVWTVGPPYLVVVAGGIVALGCILLREDHMARLNGQLRLQISENNLFRAMVEALPDCLNVKDTEGRFVIANGATARQMGVDGPKALIGRTDWDFHPEDLARDYHAEDAKVVSAAKPQALRQEVQLPDGGRGWLSTLKVPFRDASGDIIGIITHNRDITTEHQLESELDAARTLLEDALACMADGFALFDTDDRMLFCNPRLAELFPLTADVRVPGRTMKEMLTAQISRGESLGPADARDLDSWAATATAYYATDGRQQLNLRDGRWIDIVAKRTSAGGKILSYRDVTSQKQLELETARLALLDPLTGVGNRELFNRRLVDLQKAVVRGEGCFVLLLLDLDKFKQVNDTHGHAAGDALLVEVAGRLRAVLREGDTVVRLGGDEFAVLLRQPMMASERAGQLAQGIADRIRALLAEPLAFRQTELRPMASIGLAVVCEPGESTEAIFTRADDALYSAKRMDSPERRNERRVSDIAPLPEGELTASRVADDAVRVLTPE